jgi:penicillin G amidase
MKLARYFWWLLLVVIGLLVLAAATASVYVMRASPLHEGQLQMPGLQGDVSIERDANGIPTIRAGSIEDAAYALGVAHAQDRLWQLQTHLRIGSGRMAEAFGAAALDGDKFLRALGVKRAAQAQWANLKNPESRRVLQAYSAGINNVIEQHTSARPPELVILGLPAEKWTPEDSLAWGIMMAWDLGGNWTTELLRLRMALTLPVERVNELIPPYPGDKPLATADYAAMFREMKLGGALSAPGGAKTVRLDWMDQLLAAAPPSGIEGVGSNNWVVAGSHTTTGKPLLANDPHLKITTPALWYFARIEVGGTQPFKVAGATIPGLPVVVLGQNEHIAWGFTNTSPDVQDLYLEKLNPGDRSQVQTPTGWAALQSSSEVIKVKGGADVTMAVRRSRHGPVVSDAGGGAGLVAGESGQSGYAIAMRWTALDDDVDPISVSIGMQRATSADQFVQTASAGWVAPMQNMVVADRSGDRGRIAVVSPGRVPLRGADHDLKGIVPALGWDAKYDWQGWLAHEQTPREANPARGWIATANQRIHAADYPHFLTVDWALPYRQQRIEQVLGGKPKHSLDDMATLQADVQSLAAQSMLPLLKQAKSDHPLAAAAMAALKDFNGNMGAQAAAPLIFNAWARQMTRATFTDELGGAAVYDKVVAARSFRDALDAMVVSNNTWWCDDKTTPATETCQAQAGVALTRALDELQQRFGKDVRKWQWGAAHQARSEHRPFSRVKALAPFFELRVPTGGDSFTVNVGRVGLQPDSTTGELYLNEHAASLRALYDVGDPRQSRVMQSSGQSGLPWSHYYASFVKPWADVQYVPLWVDGETARAGGVLKLLPSP